MTTSSKPNQTTFPMTRRIITLGTWVLALAAASLAQSEIGGATLNGNVNDPSGAGVSGAKIRLSSSETGVNRDTITSDAGMYSFTRVPVGVYTLAVDHPGFKGARQEN